MGSTKPPWCSTGYCTIPYKWWIWICNMNMNMNLTNICANTCKGITQWKESAFGTAYPLLWRMIAHWNLHSLHIIRSIGAASQMPRKFCTCQNWTEAEIIHSRENPKPPNPRLGTCLRQTISKKKAPSPKPAVLHLVKIAFPVELST